jgi:hypothetical protein
MQIGVVLLPKPIRTGVVGGALGENLRGHVPVCAHARMRPLLTATIYKSQFQPFPQKPKGRERKLRKPPPCSRPPEPIPPPPTLLASCEIAVVSQTIPFAPNFTVVNYRTDRNCRPISHKFQPQGGK